jgi:hypothetical protein
MGIFATSKISPPPSSSKEVAVQAGKAELPVSVHIVWFYY